MSNIQKQHKISPAIAWLTIQKFIIFYCPLDGEHTTLLAVHFTGNFCGCFYGSAFFNCSYQAVVWSLSLLFMNTVYFFVLICMTSDCSSHTYIRHFPDSAPSNFPSNCFSSAEPLVLLKCSFGSPFFNNFTDFISSFSPYWCNRM